MSEGAKGRKFDRHSKRSPSMANYRNSNRMAINKAKKIAKNKKLEKKQANKVMKTPRGTARAARRAKGLKCKP
jgi:hypothetical protein